MKKFFLLLSFILVLFSCQKRLKINKDFDCKAATFSNLETITDMKNLFSVQFPKNWKTNLYFDDGQSSIFGADTTKQLTQTLLLDVSFIQKSTIFDDTFKLNLERDNLAEKLIRIKAVNTKFKEKESYYSLSVGKKGTYSYKVLDYFIRVNNQNLLHIKSRIYGDSLVNERLCKGIQLIEKIKFN